MSDVDLKVGGPNTLKFRANLLNVAHLSSTARTTPVKLIGLVGDCPPCKLQGPASRAASPDRLPREA